MQTIKVGCVPLNGLFSLSQTLELNKGKADGFFRFDNNINNGSKSLKETTQVVLPDLDQQTTTEGLRLDTYILGCFFSLSLSYIC